jgi:hypothetical protein
MKGDFHNPRKSTIGIQSGAKNIGIISMYWLKVFTLCAPINPSSKKRTDVSTTDITIKRIFAGTFAANAIAKLTATAGTDSEMDFDNKYCHGCNGVAKSAVEVPDCFSKSIITPKKINPIMDGSENMSRITTSVGMLKNRIRAMYRIPIPRAIGKMEYLKSKIKSHFKM